MKQLRPRDIALLAAFALGVYLLYKYQHAYGIQPLG